MSYDTVRYSHDNDDIRSDPAIAPASVEGGVVTNRASTAHSRHADDLALAARIVGRDETAMREVYDTLSGPLTGFTKACLGNPNDAADVVHETFMELWNRADRYEGRASLKSWLYAVARFKSIDRNRKAKRTVYTDQTPDIVDSAPNAADVLAVSQDAEAVRAAVAELGESHRRAIHMSFFEHMTYREIAVVEGVPLGTIKTRVLHAKRLLLHALSRQSEP